MTASTNNGRSACLVFAIVLTLSGLLQLGGLVPALRYSREAIAAGEVWRLLTAHLVHLDAGHLLLNAVGMILAAALVGRELRASAWVLVMLWSALAISAGLWWAEPALQWYVGLSGVLHGLLAAGAFAMLARAADRRFALMLLGLLSLKLLWEQLAGPLPGSAALTGGTVVVNAHLFGAMAGAAAGVTALACRRRPD